MVREEPEAKLNRLTYADEATDERGRDWSGSLLEGLFLVVFCVTVAAAGGAVTCGPATFPTPQEELLFRVRCADNATDIYEVSRSPGSLFEGPQRGAVHGVGRVALVDYRQRAASPHSRVLKDVGELEWVRVEEVDPDRGVSCLRRCELLHWSRPRPGRRNDPGLDATITAKHSEMYTTPSEE